MTATSIYIFILHLGSVNVWETPELKELCKKLLMKNGEPYVEITKLSQDEQKVIAEAIRGAVVYRKYLSLVKALAVAEQEQKAKNPPAEAFRKSAVEHFAAPIGYSHWSNLQRTWDGRWSYMDYQVSSSRVFAVPEPVRSQLEASYQKKYGSEKQA